MMDCSPHNLDRCSPNNTQAVKYHLGQGSPLDWYSNHHLKPTLVHIVFMWLFDFSFW